MELMKLRESELVGTDFLEDLQEFVRILYTELNGRIGGGKLSNSLFSEYLLPALAFRCKYSFPPASVKELFGQYHELFEREKLIKALYSSVLALYSLINNG